MMVEKKYYRLTHIWMSRMAVGVFIYRFERAMGLLFGNYWKFFRIIFFPIFYILKSYSNIDISYKANIGKGLRIVHPEGGIVIASNVDVGINLTLIGGNFIGRKEFTDPNASIRLGDDCVLGANSVILGPLILGDRVKVGALSVVLKDHPSDSNLGGVPARRLKK